MIQAPPEKKTGEDGLPVPPYAIYNIGNNHPENLLEFVDILQQELIRAGVLPEDYDFDSHKELVPICGPGYGSSRSGIRRFIVRMHSLQR